MEIHVSPEMQKAIEGLALQNDTSPEEQAQALLAYAVARAADHDLWAREKVREGKVASECGELIEHEEVVRMFESRFRG